MLIRPEYKYKITTTETGERVIIYYDDNGDEVIREAYTPTPNIFDKMDAAELTKIKSEMDIEYIFLKNRKNELDDDYDNLMLRQTELLNK